MADEALTIRSISWKDVFPFSVIFRTFRVSIHPSKLLLALVALIIVFIGGTILDALVPSEYMAVPDELPLYERSAGSVDSNGTFSQLRQDAINDQKASIHEQLTAIGKPNGTVDDLRLQILADRDKAVAKEKDPDAVARTYALTDDRIEGLDRIHQGLFHTFTNYELGQGNLLVHGVRNGNLIAAGGASACILRMLIVAPSWAVKHHPLFFTIYGLFFLAIWSVFGGAITRIAAVHYARDEKISIRQALAFSTSKFLSFVSAPIIPLIIVLLIGACVVAGGLLLNVPFLGPIVVGAFYVLVLVAAFVIMLVLLGLAGGLNLMYPTIAVEGSDSFDAISRSFSYLYARPWRLGFYSLVSIAYGAITYLFVRYFIYILLNVAHFATGVGVFTHAASSTPLWQTMWPSPVSIGRLSYVVNWQALSIGERIGAGLLAFWVYLVIALLGAFGISFYFSANTIIYYLMRREVDGTEMDDVYLEQTDDDFGDVVIKSTEITADGVTAAVVTPINPPSDRDIAGVSGNPVPPPEGGAPVV